MNVEVKSQNSKVKSQALNLTGFTLFERYSKF